MRHSWRVTCPGYSYVCGKQIYRKNTLKPVCDGMRPEHFPVYYVLDMSVAL